MNMMPEAHAAAVLYARSLNDMGVVNTVWRKRDSNVVSATTSGQGVHLLNQATDFDANIHLICETKGVREAGNLPNDIPNEDHGPIFFNVKVRGIADDPDGHGLPTHISGRTGAKLRDDMSNELASIAEQAGIDI